MKVLFEGVLAVLLFISCSAENREIPTLEVGQEFTDSNVRVISIDTFTVKLSTMKFDSINSSSSSRLLIGRYQDEYFGKVSSASYLELSTINYTISNDAELDSIALILAYDNYFYNDTTQIVEISVHELLEDLEPEDNVFYNTSRLKYDSVPLVTRRYLPEPRDEDSLHISIPIKFGQQIFELIQENDINDDDELREIFKGFTLQPSANENGAIIGFTRNSDRTYLRFFYSESEEFGDEEGTFDLSINMNLGLPRAFNNIQSEVNETPLELLIDQEVNLASTSSNNLSFIQNGAGYATRIEFPTIRDISEVSGTGTVLSAVLQLKPLKSSYDDTLPIRDSLNVQVVDRNNIITETIVNGNGAVFGRLDRSEAEFNEIFYNIPLGVWIDRELEESPIIEDALILYPNNYNESVDRVVLQGEGNEDFEAKLILTYAIYDE